MAKLAIAAGSTSVSLYIFVGDSSSTTGGGRTGLAFNTAGLTAFYVRNRSAPVQITLATLASNAAVWSSGGFIEVDSTNMAGVYRLDVPDAAFVSGSRNLVIYLRGATNMAPVPLEIDLDAEVDVAFWRAVQPNALVGNRPDVHIGSIANNVITATAVANGALNGKGDWLTAAGYTAPPTTGAITTAVLAGLGTAGNLDTNLGNILASANSAARWGDTMETGVTYAGAMRVQYGVAAGNTTNFASGASTGVQIRNQDGSKVRVTANIDANGNRTVTARDLT